MRRILTKDNYPFLYETHLHTRQASACAYHTGAQMTQACKAAGYSGIIVTDHNWGGNTAINRRMPWKYWVKEFCTGYRDAKQMGDKIGLQVFFGFEAGFQGTEFLIYGVDETWLMSHEELRTATVEEQYQMIYEAGGMVIHAHPYREEDYIPEIRLYPEAVDGVEVINATHSCHRSTGHNVKAYDDRAIAYAAMHQLPMTAGSDIHKTDLLCGGMAFCKKLNSIQDFIAAVKGKEDYLLCNGDYWYSRAGEKMDEVEYDEVE